MTAPRLITLTGPAGCGKTTVARELEHRGFVRVRFAGTLKEMLRTLGLTESQVDGDAKEEPSALLCGATSRHAMQTLGTEWGRNMIGDELWINAAMIHVDNLLAGGRDVVIDDCRFDNEARAIIDRGGQVYALLREQPRRSTLRKSLWQRVKAWLRREHASEAGIAEHYIHDFIDNNGHVRDTVAQIYTGPA